MNFVVGIVIALGCVLGGFASVGGKIGVLWQPAEFIVICGAAVGIFVVANPLSTIKDAGKGTLEAIKGSVPKKRDYLDLLGLLYVLMRELRGNNRNELEAQIDTPKDSDLFKRFPKVLADSDMTSFICDYCRLILIGNARTHEIEALMDEEIQTINRDKQKAYQAITSAADGLPALGIVAAVLGIIKAMGAIDQSPEVLGELIGAALVGTFAGIFLSYGLVGPVAHKIRVTREKKARLYVIIKQTLLAFMNGAMPLIALEHGRKTISSYDRPSIDDVENETMNGGQAPDSVKQAA
ncbi:MAG: flagellar motor stator protein MotA [Beijerinckiaceae bacterium]